MVIVMPVPELSFEKWLLAETMYGQLTENYLLL